MADDTFGFKVVTRDYLSPNFPSERWTVGAHHRLPPSTVVHAGERGYHFCETLADLKQWLYFRESSVRLLRVRVPAGATISRAREVAAASELVVVEELSSLWHLTGLIKSWRYGNKTRPMVAGAIVDMHDAVVTSCLILMTMAIVAYVNSVVGCV
jgi:hypothetical protein